MLAKNIRHFGKCRTCGYLITKEDDEGCPQCIMCSDFIACESSRTCKDCGFNASMQVSHKDWFAKNKHTKGYVFNDRIEDWVPKKQQARNDLVLCFSRIVETAKFLNNNLPQDINTEIISYLYKVEEDSYIQYSCWKEGDYVSKKECFCGFHESNS